MQFRDVRVGLSMAAKAGALVLKYRNMPMHSPSGRLPVTFYKSIEQLPDATDYAVKNRTYRHFSGQALPALG